VVRPATQAKPLRGLAWILAPAAAVVAFFPSLWAGFLADDFVMLRTTSVLHLPWQAFVRTDIGGTQGHPYRPIWVVVMGALNWISSDSAVAHHALNIVLYAASAVLVIVIAGRFAARRVAVLAGVAFALYPRHGEAVAWNAGSTDVIAGVLALGSLAALTAEGAPAWGLVVCVASGVAAALSKETAFALPALAVVLVAARWTIEDPSLRRRRVAGIVALTVALAAVFVVRIVVVHGLGNDVTEPFGAHRFVVVVASYLIATASTSHLLVLRHPALLGVPLVVGALLVLGAFLTFRSSDGTRKRLLVVGALWFVVSLVPLYNNAVNLNTANGERLLYLPSVGTALVFAAVAAPLLDMRLGRWAMGALAVVALGLCLVESLDYVTAGTIRDRVVADALRLTPKRGTVVLLNVPDSYRSARLFGAGFAEAMARSGRPHLTVLVCAPSVVETRTAQPVRFSGQPGGQVLAHATPDLPFDTPESGRGISTSGCVYGPAPGGRLARGLGTDVLLTPAPAPNPLYLWFDGVDLHVCEPATCLIPAPSAAR